MKRFGWIAPREVEEADERMLIDEGRSETHQAQIVVVFNDKTGDGRILLRIAEVNDEEQRVVRHVVAQGYSFNRQQVAVAAVRTGHIHLREWVAEACERLDRGLPAGDTPDLTATPPEVQIASACGALTAYVVGQLWPRIRDESDLKPAHRRFAEALESGLRKRVEAYWRDDASKGKQDRLHDALLESLAVARAQTRLGKRQLAELDRIADASSDVIAAMKQGLDPTKPANAESIH